MAVKSTKRVDGIGKHRCQHYQVYRPFSQKDLVIKLRKVDERKPKQESMADRAALLQYLQLGLKSATERKIYLRQKDPAIKLELLDTKINPPTLSCHWIKPCSILLPRKQQQQHVCRPTVSDDSDSEGQVASESASLINIDITSPLGLLVSESIGRVSGKTETTKDIDRYCNRPPPTEDQRTLRSTSSYGDRGPKDFLYRKRHCHKHVDRTYAFGRRQQREKFHSRKSKLNKESRRLLKQMKPCSIKLIRHSERWIGEQTQSQKSSSPGVPGNREKGVGQTLQLVAPSHDQSPDVAAVLEEQPASYQRQPRTARKRRSRKVADDRSVVADANHMCTLDAAPPVKQKDANLETSIVEDAKDHFTWEDFVEEPAPSVVDLTLDSSDEEDVYKVIPSPTSLLDGLDYEGDGNYTTDSDGKLLKEPVECLASTDIVQQLREEGIHSIFLDKTWSSDCYSVSKNNYNKCSKMAQDLMKKSLARPIVTVYGDMPIRRALTEKQMESSAHTHRQISTERRSPAQTETRQFMPGSARKSGRR